jgi:hypothetical protein
MASVQERLRAAGILPVDGRPQAPSPEYARLASVLAGLRVRSVGLVPAADDVGVPLVALHLAAALALVEGGVVGVVDAEGSWPAPAGDEGTGAEAPPLVTVELSPKLMLFTGRARPGTEVQRIRDALEFPGHRASWMVIDLTGLDRSGEHLAAMSEVDRIAVVARAGRTTAAQLERRLREVPLHRSLGVLLVGAVP